MTTREQTIHTIRTEADRTIRMLMATFPEHQYEVLEAFGRALVSRSYALGEECAKPEDDL